MQAGHERGTQFTADFPQDRPLDTEDPGMRRSGRRGNSPRATRQTSCRQPAEHGGPPPRARRFLHEPGGPPHRSTTLRENPALQTNAGRAKVERTSHPRTSGPCTHRRDTFAAIRRIVSALTITNSPIRGNRLRSPSELWVTVGGSACTPVDGATHASPHAQGRCIDDCTSEHPPTPTGYTPGTLNT